VSVRGLLVRISKTFVEDMLTFVGGTWKKSNAFVIELILSPSIL